ncbi:hypothetical protein Glove_15g25 [Diversispora epigaea]|uniref:Uncharacterized protein n=1 Tax=Diversispora epigaea TaxID=1348612 RepID=A0A397JY52_9GLOM|nr:hypothetical protein Glove_15g25 [Diversispora epigaea]
MWCITSFKGKRKLEGADEKSEGQEIKKVKLVATANKIMEGIMKLSDILDRFAINDDGIFTFLGRTEFNNVLSEINNFKSGTSTGYMEMFIYGTVGYEKSHILTAISCFLLRTGRRVVYLPDCRKLAVDEMEYIKSALFLIYVDGDTKTTEIDACESFDQIVKFCRKLGETLYFIVDQMNAMDTIMILELIRKKATTKQTNEKKITLYGGFDKDEMKEWHNSVLLTMSEKQKNQVEDITDKKPDGKLFGQYKGRKERISHRIDVIVSDKGYPPSGYGDSDFDHCFFYIKDERCHYVYGMAWLIISMKRSEWKYS